MVSSTESEPLPGKLVLTPHNSPELFCNPEEKKPPATPSEWFIEKFPQQAQIYGVPFIEQHENTSSGKRITPIAMNTDFMAAVLGGDHRMQHRVIYFEPDLVWYYYEPVCQIFKPTTEEKLQNLLRAYLLRCAQEMPDNVHKLPLCIEFRSDKQVRAVVQRGKSIHAAESNFFGVGAKHERVRGPEQAERLANLFAQRVLKVQENEVLTIGDAHKTFTRFLEMKGQPPLNRPMFKSIIVPLIRDQFNLGLRNDLRPRPEDKQLCGWKNLKAMDLGAALATN